MLKVCFQAITTGQKIWSRFPAPRQTIREMSGQLGMNAAKIVEVESDGSVFAPYLIGKEVPPEKGYKEVDFLERRMECLTRKEQQVFQEALEMEHPETLEEMVNLSCNLDKFELLEDGKGAVGIHGFFRASDNGECIGADILCVGALCGFFREYGKLCGLYSKPSESGAGRGAWSVY